jgi:N-methylhydantoinase A
MAGERADLDKIVMERYLDMRYQGQSYEIMVPFAGDFIETFHHQHERKYGYCNRDKDVEIVNIRLRARGFPEKPTFTRSQVYREQLPADAIMGVKAVHFDGQTLSTRVLFRDRLISGNRIEGPALLVEYSSTIVIPPFASGRVDGYGNMIITVN